MQLSLKLPERMHTRAKIYAELHGFATVQEFIRELIRERLFERELMGGLYTSIASEESLARSWLTQEEEKAWAHLQKEI